MTVLEEETGITDEGQGCTSKRNDKLSCFDFNDNSNSHCESCNMCPDLEIAEQDETKSANISKKG